MPDNKGNLHLLDAIELRNDYDRHIKVLEALLEGENPKMRAVFFRQRRRKRTRRRF